MNVIKLFLVLALLSVALPAARGALKQGESFPDLATFKLEGKLPETFKDKIVLIDFWASWCGPCKDSFVALNELHKKYADRGLVIIGVNVDEERGDMNAFLKEHSASFVIIRDAEQKLVAKTGIKTMPSSFVLDGAGTVRFLHNGYHGDKTKKEYITEIESLLKK